MRSKLKGVTLLETLIYLSLFSIIIIMILNFMLATQESSQRTDRRGFVHQSSELIIQHLSDSFGKSLTISEENSTFNVPYGILQLQATSGPRKYELVNTKVLYNEESITAPNTVVTQFFLEPVYGNDNEIIGVRTDIVVRSTKDASISQNVKMLFTLR